MAIGTKRNTVYAVEVETTEGTYVAPQSAQSYVKSLSDGSELNPAKELVERDILTGSIGKVTPRTGTKSASGSLAVELCSGEAANNFTPEYDALMRSALGLRRTTPEVTIDSTDSGQAHTTTRIYLSDADAGVYEIGTSVTVQEGTQYHTSPIVAKSDVAGDVYIDLLVPYSAPFTDGTVIAASTTYVTADTGHDSLSITKYIEGARREYITGAKVTSLSLENFSTGQIASLNFGLEGIDYKCDLTPNPFEPDYDECLPPIMLNACVFIDGDQIDLNDFSFSVENSASFVTSTCSPTGRVSSRITERNVSGTINPYKNSDDCGFYDKFNCNIEFSIFATAHNTDCQGNLGEYNGTVSFYMPKAVVTELTETDLDDNLQEDISFVAGRGNDGKCEEIYITFS